MKCTIVGVTPTGFKSGGLRFTLSLLSDSSTTYGKKATILDMYDNSPAFIQLNPFRENPAELVGFELEVDFDNKGYLDNFVLGSKSVPDVPEVSEWKKK